jgi:RNA polymerase sigma-70 factor, ECF subfamily
MDNNMVVYSEFSDKKLTDLLRPGDRLAFTEIYNRYSGLLYVYAYKLTVDVDMAKDMTQEVFTSLWDKKKETVLTSSLSAYLYSAIRYKFLKLVAHQKVRQVYADELLASMEEGFNSTENYITEKELISRVEMLVAELPAKMARAFILSKLEFQSNAEIAKALNISEKTVQNLISMAVKQVKPNVGLLVSAIIMLS